MNGYNFTTFSENYPSNVLLVNFAMLIVIVRAAHLCARHLKFEFKIEVITPS